MLIVEIIRRKQPEVLAEFCRRGFDLFEVELTGDEDKWEQEWQALEFFDKIMRQTPRPGRG